MTLSAQQIETLHRNAQRALGEGRPQEAHRDCLAILNVDRRHAGAWYLCAVIAGQNGRAAQAVEILDNALALAPREARYHAEQGKYLLALGRLQEALQAARRALALQPGEIPVLDTLGTLFTHLGEHAEAIDCFDRAVTDLGNARNGEAFSADFRAALYYNRAVALQFAGRLEQAERDFESAIELRPHYFRAHSALATLRSFGPDDNHLQRLAALEGEVHTAVDQLHLGHAMARELEYLGRDQEAAERLAWAKQRHAAQVKYRFEDDEALFATVARTQSQSFFARAEPDGCDNAEAIFIVGMPRTGTTLLEQVLGSHSQVFAAGELQNFPLQVRDGVGSTDTEVLDRSIMEAASALDMQALGAAYIDSTRPRTGHTPRFIDKLPLNFLYLGLIHRALPNAKLICLRRDPMDTCVSNYRQLFGTGYRYYRYNLDLEDCGRYYIAFDRLMAHWRESMPGAVFEQSYEELVTRPESSVRALLAHCELPWEDQCLQLRARDRSVATPSAGQVRQGIYTDSVQRWRKFGDAVQPLYDLLRRAGYYD